MQSHYHLFSSPTAPWQLSLAVGGVQGITGLEFVSAVDAAGDPVACTLSAQYAGPQAAGTDYLKPGDTVRYDQDSQPNGLTMLCDVTPAYVHLRAGRGWSFRAPNATLQAPTDQLDVGGPLPFGSSPAALSGYDNPLVPSMVKDESEQGNGPWTNRPLRTYSNNGLWVEQVDDFEGFAQNFDNNVAVERDVKAFGMARVSLESGAPSVAFTDNRDRVVPIFRLSTLAWIATGIAPALGDYYVPCQGVGTLKMVNTGGGSVWGHIARSPRPMTPMI